MSKLTHSLYARIGKRALGAALSATAAVVLSPVIAACAVAVKATSPGPVLFRQRRVGVHLREFDIYKFRTMRTDTPELPSHELDASVWLTPVGGFLRKTSLDELPQLANIVRGDMAIVGPRPALPSQTDLIAERAKGGANGIIPGLTGWAQVHGRDELPIAVKAAYDNWYASNGGFLLDAKIVLMTVAKVLRREGVVEQRVPEPKAAGA